MNMWKTVLPAAVVGFFVLVLTACESAPSRPRRLMVFDPVRAENPGLVAGEVPLREGTGVDADSYTVPERELLWVTHGKEISGGATEFHGPFGSGVSQHYFEDEEYYPSRYFRVPSHEPVVDDGSGKVLALDVRPDRSIISSDGSTVAVRVHIGAPSFKTGRGDGTNFSIVLDFSESMGEPEKADLVRAASHWVVDQILPGDRASVVLVGLDTVRLVELDKPVNSAALHDLIDRARTGGSGGLAEALDMAFDDMESIVRENGQAGHVLVLSDGLASRGGTGAWRFADMARRRQASGGVRLHVVAIGHQVDEPFLSDLAASSDGRLSFVQSSDEVTRVLDDKLESMLHVFARNVRLQVSLLGGGSVQAVYGLELPRPLEGVDEIPLADFVPGEQRSLLLELRLPPSNPGTWFASDVRLSFQHAASSRRSQTEKHLRLLSGSRRTQEAEDRFVEAYGHLIKGIERVRIAVETRDESTARLVSAMLDEEYPQLRDQALRSADRDLLHHARLFERYASRLRALALAGKLTGASVERDELARELAYLRPTSQP